MFGNKKKEDSANKAPAKEPRLYGSVPQLDLIMSIRHLAILLKSSLAIEDALHTVEEQTSNPILKQAYRKILVEVRAGRNLSDAMEKQPKVFPNVIISIVKAGEAGGSLITNLLYLADYLKKNYELNKKIQGALFYPMIVVLLTVFEMLGVIFFILPKMDALFSSFKNIPDFTRFMLNASKYINKNFIMILIVSVITIFIVVLFFKTKPGKKLSDWTALNLPLIKVFTQFAILTNFSRTLGILLESSLPITSALEITTKSIDNSYYKKALTEVAEKVRTGNSLAASMEMHPKLFPVTYTKMIEIGEQTGTLEDNLLYLHEFYAEEVQDMSTNFASLIEPLLLIFIGIMIGFLALSIIAPIYQLTTSIN